MEVDFVESIVIENGSSTENLDLEVDHFKETFKYYRLVQNCKTDSNILNLQENEHDAMINGQVQQISPSVPGISPEKFWYLKPWNEWKIFRFNFPEGLIYLQCPFKPEGQKYWIRRSLLEFPDKPHITNIQNLINRKRNPEGEIKFISPTDPDYYKKLRWVTFGYHHNWDTKVYSESEKCEFPEDLKLLTKYFAEVLGFENYNPEAAIINYYNLDSTLSGHRDYSEPNQDAPLFSLSFGQTALFLIGGPTKSIKPAAIYLTSGDLVVMSGKSRLSYHAVPKILKTNRYPWLDDVYHDTGTDNSGNNSETGWNEFCSDYISSHRINLNIRQVLKSGQEFL